MFDAEAKPIIKSSFIFGGCWSSSDVWLLRGADTEQHHRSIHVYQRACQYPVGLQTHSPSIDAAYLWTTSLTKRPTLCALDSGRVQIMKTHFNEVVGTHPIWTFRGISINAKISILTYL